MTTISQTYPNVLIPVNPTWKSDFECLHHLSQQCPCLQFIGVTTSYNVAPLFALEGSIYPEIEPPFRNCVGWVLKPTQKWVDISSNRRLSEVNKTLDSQTQQLNEMKVISEKPQVMLSSENLPDSARGLI